MKTRYKSPQCRVTLMPSELPVAASNNGYTVNDFKSTETETLGGDEPAAGTKANSVKWENY